MSTLEMIFAIANPLALLGWLGLILLPGRKFVVDGIGGLVGTLASLRGLRRVMAGETGGWFDISQLEAYVALSGDGIVDATRHGLGIARAGNRSRHRGIIQGAFPCRGSDEWIAIRLEGEGDRATFATVCGLADPLPAIARLPRGAGVIFRHYGAKGRDELGAAVARACRARGLVLLVAVDAGLALRLRADGIHLPERALHQLRHLNRQGWLVTAAAHGGMGLRRARGADDDDRGTHAVDHRRRCANEPCARV